MMKLTEKQQAVLDFIVRSVQEQGRSPTIREISRNFGMSTPHGVLCHLNALERKGFVQRDRLVARGIRLTPLCDPRKLPKAGSISAGPLFEAIEELTTFSLTDLFGDDASDIKFKVADDGTIEPQICKGDLLLLRAGWLIGLIRFIDRYRLPGSRSVQHGESTGRRSASSANCQQPRTSNCQQVASSRRRASGAVHRIDDSPSELTAAKDAAYPSHCPGTAAPHGRRGKAKRSASA
jgi:hypothetical protein